MTALLTAATTTPFRGSLAVREGRVTRGRLRGPSFVPVLPDVYVGADADRTDPGLRRRALAVWGGPTAVVGGSLAAHALRVDTVDEVAEVVIPGWWRAAPRGVRVRTDRLSPSEVVRVGGVRVTSPVRTALDLARRHPLADGVAMLDTLGRRHRFGPDAVRAAIDAHPNIRGLVRAREAVALMDRLAESLPESRARVALVTRGVVPTRLQHRVSTPVGAYRLDLAWVPEKVAVEYDGEEHRFLERHGRDLDRDAALADAGWVVVRVTKTQLDRPDELAARIRALLIARAGRDRAQG